MNLRSLEDREFIKCKMIKFTWRIDVPCDTYKNGDATPPSCHKNCSIYEGIRAKQPARECAYSEYFLGEKRKCPYFKEGETVRFYFCKTDCKERNELIHEFYSKAVICEMAVSSPIEFVNECSVDLSNSQRALCPHSRPHVPTEECSPDNKDSEKTTECHCECIKYTKEISEVLLKEKMWQVEMEFNESRFGEIRGIGNGILEQRSTGDHTNL